MKKKFSLKWKGSSKARKQRKYRANAPLHLKQRFMSSNLSKDLRKNYGRSLQLRKNDIVRVLSGKFKNKKGKVLTLNLKREKVTIEGIQLTKKDGNKVAVLFHPSKLQITELNTDDKKRFPAKAIEEKKGNLKKDTENKKLESKEKMKDTIIEKLDTKKEESKK